MFCLFSRLLVPFISFELVLHVFNGILIKFTFDLSCFLNVIVLSQEFVKASHWVFQILNTHAFILVKIESHPLSLHCNMNLWISRLNIRSDLFLLCGDNVNKACNFIGSLVVKEKHTLHDWLQNRVNLRIKSLPMFLHNIEFVCKIYHCINSLIKGKALDCFYPLISVVESNV